MKKFFNNTIVFILILSFSFTLFGCSDSRVKTFPEYEIKFADGEDYFEFLSSSDVNVSLSSNDVDLIGEVIEVVEPDFFLEKMFELEEVKTKTAIDFGVEKHDKSIADSNGNIDISAFAAAVAVNNESYLENKVFGLENLEENEIFKICEVIVATVEKAKEKYPELDWNKVYCTLADLKILMKTGLLSFAQVDKERVLSVNPFTASISEMRDGKNSYFNVLVHETVHMIQIGCPCEEKQHEMISRRCGLSCFWDDFSANTADWPWLIEGSAEYFMSKLTGISPRTYKFKVGYINSYTMSAILNDNVNVDDMAKLCFSNDINDLYNVFSCETQEEKDNFLRLLITTQMLQDDSDAFAGRYKDAFGIDISQSDDADAEFRYSVKPTICISFAKEFYENLTALLNNKEIPLNDVFFLINIFESHINTHLKYTSSDNYKYNKIFVSKYLTVRDAFFDRLGKTNGISDCEEKYLSYEMFDETTLKINASISFLSEEKRDFFSERVNFLRENASLGVKVTDTVFFEENQESTSISD